jgi:toxin ParE1/3/4
MNYRLVPSAEADNDVFDIACYLADQREGLGFRFYECVDATYQQITDNPQWKGVGPFQHPEAQNIRICPVQQFKNYLIFYRIESDRIEILRVLHGARDYMSLFDAP